MAVIECVPNISEGRRTNVIEAVRAALRAVPGLRVLDVQSDASHNRSVFTLAGDADAMKAGIPILFESALAAIDLRTHQGEHPRLGAVDVVPFIPIEGVTMEACVELAKAVAADVAARFSLPVYLFEGAIAAIDLKTHKGEHPRMGAVDVTPFIPIDGVTMAECVALAKSVAQDVASRFSLPVYLYEEASANPERKNLEDIRRGEFEGLAAKMTQPAWVPDYGPASPHQTAGATVIGARMPLIAYNINLATNRLDVAKKIASAIRMSSGGLRYVKAMGIPLEDRGIVQVSMNLTNYEKTPIFRVFDLVKREAARYGVTVLDSEIVGLVPAAAMMQTAEYFLQLEGFTPGQVLENKLSSRRAE
jgi:glutamate formiminotransferase